MFINDVDFHVMRAGLAELQKRVERLEAIVIGVEVNADEHADEHAPSAPPHESAPRAATRELTDAERAQLRAPWSPEHK
jgi:hypothetical protein